MYWSLAQYRSSIGSYASTARSKSQPNLDKLSCYAFHHQDIDYDDDDYIVSEWFACIWMIQMKEWITDYEESEFFQDMMNHINVVFEDSFESTDEKYSQYCAQIREDCECEYFASLWFVQCNLFALQQEAKAKDVEQDYKSVCFDELSVGANTCTNRGSNDMQAPSSYFTSLWFLQAIEYSLYKRNMLMQCNDVEKNPGPTGQPNISKFIQGSFHQGDSSKFSDSSVGKQCMTNCLAALMFSKKVNCSVWDATSLDNILIEGDKLYTEVKGEIDKNLASIGTVVDFENTSYLNTYNLPEYKRCFNENFKIKKSRYLSNVTTEDTLSNFYYKNILQQLQKHTGAIFLVNGYASCIFCQQGTYYMFDSHSRNALGMVDPDGSSVLLQFHDVADLENYVWHQTQYFRQVVFSMTFLDLKFISNKALDLGLKRTQKNKTENPSCHAVHNIQPIQDDSSKPDTIVNTPQYDAESQKPLSIEESLTNYFAHQQQCVITHKKQSDLNKKKELRTKYMTEYMRARRQIDYKRAEERKCERNQKKNKRANLVLRSKERECDKVQRQILRHNPIQRSKERECEKKYKHKTRLDPMLRSKERECDKVQRQISRLDPIQRSKERECEKEHKQKTRLDPILRSKERECDKFQRQKSRLDPIQRSKERECEKEHKQKTRLDPMLRSKERECDKVQRQMSRLDPIQRSKERKCDKIQRQKLRLDPIQRSNERECDKNGKNWLD